MYLWYISFANKMSLVYSKLKELIKGDNDNLTKVRVVLIDFDMEI